MSTSEVLPCLPRACSHCPWRIGNQGKRTTDGFYSKANLQRLWNGMKQGEQMSCHPTDPRMNEFESAPRVRDDATTHVCAGATILLQREYMRFQELMQADGEMGYRRYRGLGGPRLTRDALFQVAMRASVRVSNLIISASGKPDLEDLDVQYPPLGIFDGPPRDA